MDSKLLIAFNGACSVLSKIVNINYGGCGIAVYSIYLYLKSKGLLTEEFQVITLYESDTHNYKTNFSFVNGDINYANPAWHVAITFDRGVTVYDSNGLFTGHYEKSLIIPTNKTEGFLLKAINNSGWNSDFDRSTQVPIIEKQLNIKLDIKCG